MSTYEEFTLIIGVVGLIIMILNYRENQKNNHPTRKVCVIISFEISNN